jgi:hypothetical protein
MRALMLIAVTLLCACRSVNSPTGRALPEHHTWRLVEVPTPPLSLRVGSLVGLSDGELQVLNPDGLAVRMLVTWDEVSGSVVSGLLASGGRVRFEARGDSVGVWQDTSSLGQAVLLTGDEERAAAARLAAIPAYAEVLDHARRCVGELERAEELAGIQQVEEVDGVERPLPRTSFDTVKSTAPARALHLLALHRFADHCWPVSPSCEGLDLTRDELASLSKARERCAPSK